MLAAALVLYLIYAFGISKSIAAYQESKSIQQKMELVKNAPALTQDLEKQLAHMNARIGTDGLKKLRAEEPLLDLLSNYCKSNKAILREFPAAVNFQQGDLLIETNRFVLEGDFKTLLKLVYQLEQKHKLGKVASVHYAYKKDRISRQMALTATIYLQNIKQKKDTSS